MVDTRDTPEQAELRRSAWQLSRELAPAAVADLDDTTRRKRLTGAVRDAGWLELRDDDESRCDRRSCRSADGLSVSAPG